MGTISNRDAIGSRVALTAGGRRQIREVDGGNGYSSQSWRTLHFGLGSSRRVDKIEISWPGGTRQVIEDIDANRLMTVEEPREPSARGRAMARIRSISPPVLLRFTMASRESAFIEITPEVLLKAYACGIFPMAESADDPALYWIEPEKRGLIPIDRFHVPARLARTVR